MSDRNLIMQGAITEDELNEMANDHLLKRLEGKSFGVVDGELIRGETPWASTLMWCAVHSEPVWMYCDGSTQCPRQDSTDHEIRSFPFEMKEALL